MKTATARLGLVYLILIIISLMFSNISDAKIDPESIVGVWLFDEGKGDITKDSSQNGNDGKLILNPEWTEGKFAQALTFHGTDYVEVPHSKNLDITEKITVTAWIKTTHPSLQTIVGKDNDKGEERSWHFATTQEGGKTGVLRFTVFPGHITLLGNTPVNTDEWLFASATFDGKNHKVYLNGVEDGVGQKSGPLPSIEEPVQIGVMDETNGSKWYLRGLIDEVAIFNVVLSEDDLKTIMTEGLETILAVSPLKKLSTTWSNIKSQY